MILRRSFCAVLTSGEVKSPLVVDTFTDGSRTALGTASDAPTIPDPWRPSSPARVIATADPNLPRPSDLATDDLVEALQCQAEPEGDPGPRRPERDDERPGPRLPR